ncbi:hypothetical protein [Helicobacter felis]|uniref:hypothetical protein n=1 Tax=Helicobacter felis TaxID=214 RepID=UPI001F2ABF3F|nr:hypothetical protein [Helicobacter felis]
MRLALLAVLVVGLSAESSGFYTQVGFQYSNATQDSAASNTDIQALNTAVSFEKTFPPTFWTAPFARDVPFKDKLKNPFIDSDHDLQELSNWDGKKNIDALKADYQKNAEQLMSAWIAYTIESAQKDTPNAPNTVIGNLINALGQTTSFAMGGYANYKFTQPQLKAAFQAFDTASKQVATALGVGNNIFFWVLMVMLVFLPYKPKFPIWSARPML